MIKAKGIDHININVKSIDKAKDYYQKYFGFKVVEDYYYSNNEGGETRFMLLGDSGKLMLCLYEDPTSNSNNESSPLSHIGINVENFEESYELADKHGLINPRYGVKDYSDSRSFYMIDPNGIEIEISEVFTGGH